MEEAGGSVMSDFDQGEGWMMCVSFPPVGLLPLHPVYCLFEDLAQGRN